MMERRRSEHLFTAHKNKLDVRRGWHSKTPFIFVKMPLFWHSHNANYHPVHRKAKLQTQTALSNNNTLWLRRNWCETNVLLITKSMKRAGYCLYIIIRISVEAKQNVNKINIQVKTNIWKVHVCHPWGLTLYVLVVVPQSLRGIMGGQRLSIK